MAERGAIAVIVQARFNSARLPGKVLRPMAGRPMLAHLFDRVRRAQEPDAFWLATSTASTDDPVAALAASLGIACHRGPLDDVLSRFIGAAEASHAGAVVRVNGDSPLLDPALIDRAIAIYRAGQADLVTNVFPRSFPKGQSVEVIGTETLARIDQRADGEDREHVTLHAYRHPADFAISNFAAAHPASDLQLAVDTTEDFAFVESLLRRVAGFPRGGAVDELITLAGAATVHG